MGATGSVRGGRARGLWAAAVLLLLTVGFPFALWAVAGSPIPDGLPGAGDVTAALGSPVQNGVLLGVLKYVAWLGWLVFTVSVVVEVAARLRGVRAPNLGPQQALAGALVAAAALGLAGPAMASAPAAAPVAVEQTHVPAPDPLRYDTPVPIAPIGTSPQTPPPGFHARVIGEGELLWDIAEEELGDGLRYTEIFAASTGIEQPDGSRIERPHLVREGWTVWIPDTAAADTAEPRSVVVQRGDNLWDIAGRTLGDPQRYMEIYRANAGVVQADGLVLSDPRSLEPGWVLRVPAAPDTPTPDTPTPDTPTPDAAPLTDLGTPLAARQFDAPGVVSSAGPLDTTTPLTVPITPLTVPAAPGVPAPGAAPLADLGTPLSAGGQPGRAATAPPGRVAADPASDPDAGTVAPLDTTTPLTGDVPQLVTPSPGTPSPDALSPAPPTGLALDTVTPLSAQAAGFTVQVDGLTARFSGLVPQGAAGSWLFGDGTAADGGSAEHTYPRAGEYLVTLSISAPHGGTVTSARRVRVG